MVLFQSNAAYRFLVAALFTLGTIHTITYWFYQPDDAFIYLVYVKNLISGNGLTFNGELVEGFSSLSWTLLSAWLASAGLDPLQGAKVLGVSSYLATALLLIIIQRNVIPSTNYWQRLGLLLMFFSFPLLALWAPAAMEGILYALLITASCYAYFLASDSHSLKHYFSAGLLFGLLAVTRPEGAAFIGAIFAYETSRKALKKELSWIGILLTLLVFGSILAALLFWRNTTFGELFPTTVSAKTGNLHEQIKHGAGYVARFTLDYFYLVIPYLLATILLLARGGREGWWAWLSLIYIGGYTSFNLLVGGDWMIGYRFMMPITPLLISVPALALQNAQLGSKLGPICFAIYSIWLSSQLHAVAVAERLATEGDIIMGKHIASMNLPADSKIAVVDAGAIPYFSGLPTIDMVGLNNKHISKVPGGFMAKWDNEYVLSQKPKVIQLHTYTDPTSKELLPSEDFRGAQLLFYTEEFQRWYEIDPTSIIPHLFIRRDEPLQPDTDFYNFQAKAHLNNEKSRLTLSLKKTGNGIWPINTTGESSVSWQIMIGDNAGKNIVHEIITLPNSMKKDDTATVTVDIPQAREGNYRILACPLLHKALKFPQCNSGFAIDLPLETQKTPVFGTTSFKDPRLSFTGWSTPEGTHLWSLGTRSSIRFTLKNSSALKGRLSLQVASFGLQKVNIHLNQAQVFNGQLNGEMQIETSHAPYVEGENLLEIDTPDAQAPSANDARLLGLALRNLQIK